MTVDYRSALLLRIDTAARRDALSIAAYAAISIAGGVAAHSVLDASTTAASITAIASFALASTGHFAVRAFSAVQSIAAAQAAQPDAVKVEPVASPLPADVKATFPIVPAAPSPTSVPDIASIAAAIATARTFPPAAEYATVAEAAKMTKRKDREIRRWIDQAVLKDVMRNPIRVNMGELKSFLDARAAGSSETSAPTASAATTDVLVPAMRLAPTATDDDIVGALLAGRAGVEVSAIVSLPNRRKRFFDTRLVLSDARGQILIPPQHPRAATTMSIDGANAIYGLKIAERLLDQVPGTVVFVDLAPTSLKDPTFRRDLAEVLRSNPEVARHIVIALPWSCIDDPEMPGVTRSFWDLDLKFALRADAASANTLNASLRALSNIAYVLRPAHAILGDPEPVAAPGRILIATSVETERQAIELTEIEVGYAAGPLIDAPKLSNLKIPLESIVVAA